MPNIYVNLPAPAGDGAGGFVDTTAMGRERTITVQGAFTGVVNVEFSCQGAFGPWTTIASFTAPGKRTIPFAGAFMRVFRAGVSPLNPGLPNVDVASNDNGGLYLDVPAPAGNGSGASTDVSALGTFNTITCLGTFSGAVTIEASEDGVDWVPCMTFTNPGFRSMEFVAQFLRVTRQGVGAPAGLPNVDVGAINDATSSGNVVIGASTQCLVFRPGSLETGPTVFGAWADLITELTALRAVNNGGGCYEILFDDSLAAPAIPAGAYDMTNVLWRGLFEQPSTIVTIVEGATFTGLREFSNLDVRSGATATSPVSDLVDGDLIVARNGAHLSQTGGVPLIDGASLGAGDVVTLVLQDGARLSSGAGAVIDLSVAGSNLVTLHQTDGVAEAETVSTAVGVGWNIRIVSSSGFVATSQSAALGTTTQNIIAHPRLELQPVPPAVPAVAPIAVPLNNQVLRLDASGGPIAQTLPAIPSVNREAGVSVIVKETSGTAGLTVAPLGGDTIDGSAAAVAVPPGGAIRFVSDGVNNWIQAAVYGSLASTLVWGASSIAAAADTRFLPPGFDTATAPLFAESGFRASHAGLLDNFRVRHNSPAGNGNVVLYDVLVNGVAQLVNVPLATGAAGDASDLVTTVALAAGDLLQVTASKALGIGAGGVNVTFACDFVG